MADLTHSNFLQKAGYTFISLLYPNQCLVCKAGRHDSLDPICDKCVQLFSPIPVKDRSQLISVQEGIDEAYVGWGFDDNLRQGIHSLKYEERAKVGSFLGKKLGNYLGQLFRDKIDIIVPVPLHHVKYRERGFNQAYWIAKGLSQNWHIPLEDKLIKRVKHTVSQTTLNREERLSNLMQAFQVKKDVDGKRIGIVDDVLTTGSTISSMATVLKAHGAKNIIALTIATPMEKEDDTYAESV